MDSPDWLAALPAWVLRVPYDGTRVPSSTADAWRSGANCQSFAYGVLALTGWRIPPLRSDQLWSDIDWTTSVNEPVSGDLVLFSARIDAYGAHVGVVASSDAVVHLCKEVGTPSVWAWAHFAARPRYSRIVGFKRPAVPTAALATRH
jgi:hypothetical protein